MRDFLIAIDQPPEGEREATPELVADAWCNDLIDGHGHDPIALLRQGKVPHEGEVAAVTLRSIAAVTMCPHHLLPAHGYVDVSYVPGESVGGLGAIARAVRAATRRLVLQESASASIAQALVDGLSAQAAACRMRLAHTCLTARGAREANAVVETIAFAGSGHRELLLAALGPSVAAADTLEAGHR